MNNTTNQRHLSKKPGTGATRFYAPQGLALTPALAPGCFLTRTSGQEG